MTDKASAVWYLECIFCEFSVFLIVALDVFVQLQGDCGDVPGEISTKKFVKGHIDILPDTLTVAAEEVPGEVANVACRNSIHAAVFAIHPAAPLDDDALTVLFHECEVVYVWIVGVCRSRGIEANQVSVMTLLMGVFRPLPSGESPFLLELFSHLGNQ